MHDRRSLELAGKGGRVRLARNGGGDFRFVAASGCRPYPEAGSGATGRPFRGTAPAGTVFGFADTHLHITADLRAGGRVIHGEAFDRFGITEALGHDADDHGLDGSEDVTGNLLRDGIPFGTHDTHGWPTFAGWPVHDTNTHQQVYYGWLERAYAAGLRLVVAQAVEDEPICRIEPLTSHSCDETETIELEIRRLEQLQDYVDAQSGGPGQGWFRLVRSPRQARRVIAEGKLAVVIGVESSNPFGCSETSDCDRRDVDRGLARMQRHGVRSMFVAHWVDNAFAGAALEGGTKGVFINIFNQLQTGHYFSTAPLPRAGPGRGGRHDRPGRDADPDPVLPRGRRDPADARVPGGQAVQLQGTDQARRLPDPPHDRPGDADRDRPHERARAGAGAEDHGRARLPPRVEPQRHRRELDGGRAQGALPRRRDRVGHPGARARARRQAARVPPVPQRRAATTSASASAPTPAASPRFRGRARTRRPTRSGTRSAPTTARSGSAASTPASGTSTSTPTAWPTTACSPTCSPTCSVGRAARPRCGRCSARPRPTCGRGSAPGRAAEAVDAPAPRFARMLAATKPTTRQEALTCR